MEDLENISDQQEQQDIDALCRMVMRLESDMNAYKLPANMALYENLTDKDTNALIVAVRTVDESKQVGAIDHLLSNGIDINGKDSMGRTALMYASLQGAKSVVKLLLNHADRIDVFSIDKMSNTALMLCCVAGQDHIAGMLLNFVKCRYDFDVMLNYLDALNDSDETAITLALKQGHVDCANELSEYLKSALDAQERSTRLGAIIGKTAKNLVKMNKKRSYGGARLSAKGAKLKPLKLVSSPKLAPVAYDGKSLTVAPYEKNHACSTPEIACHLSPGAAATNFFENGSFMRTSSCHSLIETAIGAANLSVQFGVGVHVGSAGNDRLSAISAESLNIRLSTKKRSTQNRRTLKVCKSEKEKYEKVGNIRIQKPSEDKFDNSSSSTEESLESDFTDQHVMESEDFRKKNNISKKVRRFFDRRLQHVDNRQPFCSYGQQKNYESLATREEDESSVEEIDIADIKPSYSKGVYYSSVKSNKNDFKLPPLETRRARTN